MRENGELELGKETLREKRESVSVCVCVCVCLLSACVRKEKVDADGGVRVPSVD